MKPFASTHSRTLNEGKVKQRFTRVQDESYARVNVKEHSPIYDLPAYETRHRKRKRKQILKNILDTTVFFSACSIVFSLLFWGV